MPLKYFFFSILFILAGCAPRPRVAPPPLYSGMDLSLGEVISIVSKDINALKAIAGINIQKYNKPYSHINALVFMKRPDRVRIRTYKFGIVMGDFLIKDGEVYVLGGKANPGLKEFYKEFYHSVFWWDNIRKGFMFKEGAEYIIRTENKEIHLNSATLIPVRQDIITGNKDISIMYDKPKREGDFWYPSVIKIEAGAYRFTITIEKLIINPLLGENDFNLN